jgi:hypothetical protein
MSATRLNNGSFQASHDKQQRLHTVARLLAQGLVVVLVVAFGWWGMANVGSDSLASQSDSLTVARYPIYVAGCPVPSPLEKSSARGGIGKDTGCSHEGSTHPITSRQPGGGLDRHAHGAPRQSEGKAPPRTSENSTSMHSGENKDYSSRRMMQGLLTSGPGPKLTVTRESGRGREARPARGAHEE